MADSEKSRVVVGVDGSAESLVALEWAAKHCEQSGQQLIVTAAWHIPTEHLSTALREIDLEAAARETISSALDQTKAAHLGLDIVQSVVNGSPGKVLVQGSEDAALLVVGSKRTLGTISSYCAHYASCPIVIVRTTR